MSSKARMARWTSRQRGKRLSQVAFWIPVKHKNEVREAVKKVLEESCTEGTCRHLEAPAASVQEAGNVSVRTGELAMSEVPQTAVRHLPVPRGASSLRSEKQGAEFTQSDDEFALDTLSPRTRETLLAEIGQLDQNAGIEPETADFLRGYMLGKTYQFCPDTAGEETNHAR